MLGPELLGQLDEEFKNLRRRLFGAPDEEEQETAGDGPLTDPPTLLPPFGPLPGLVSDVIFSESLAFGQVEAAYGRCNCAEAAGRVSASAQTTAPAPARRRPVEPTDACCK